MGHGTLLLAPHGAELPSMRVKAGRFVFPWSPVWLRAPARLVTWGQFLPFQFQVDEPPPMPWGRGDVAWETRAGEARIVIPDAHWEESIEPGRLMVRPDWRRRPPYKMWLAADVPGEDPPEPGGPGVPSG